MDAGSPAAARPPAWRRWAREIDWLPGMVWVAATPLTALLALSCSLTLFGEDASAEGYRATRNVMLWAAICCAGAPLAGLGLAGLARSERALRFYTVTLVIGCLPGLYWLARTASSAPQPFGG